MLYGVLPLVLCGIRGIEYRTSVGDESLGTIKTTHVKALLPDRIPAKNLNKLQCVLEK